MALRATKLWLGRSHVTEATCRMFVALLTKCGVGSCPGAQVEAQLPSSATELRDSPRFEPFAPLFTPYFNFQNYQLATLGDVIIDNYLSDIVFQYCSHTGLVLTVNATKQLNAVLHNHFSMRLFAKELLFEELAMPLAEHGDQTFGGTAAVAGAHSTLDFLDANRPGLSARDVAGTSFQVTPLSAGQSALGWKFSHFVAALNQVYGADAALAALERVYSLTGTANLPHHASALLLRVLAHFPAPNVAEAILAAQGLPVRFVGRTRVLPESEGAGSSQGPSGRTATGRGGADTDDSDAPGPGGNHAEDAGLLVLSGFGLRDGPASSEAAGAPAGNVSLDELVGSRALRRSLAEGPGSMDSVGTWMRRTEQLVEKNLEPAPAESMEDGWLSPEEQQQYKRGPAFMHSVDFSLCRTYADEYGPPQPVDGKRIGKVKFKKPVRDPLFYDRLSDMRNGVPFSTDGEPLPQYLDNFHRPHRRLFEVTVLAGADEGRVAGRAIATRYTVAREAACKAFLGGVLNDISAIAERYGQQGNS